MTNTSPPQESFDMDSDLLLMLSNQVKLSPAPVILSMITIAVMASEYVPLNIWGTWLAAIILFQGIRWLIYRKLPFLTYISVGSRLNIAVLINVINTLAHSASFLFFPAFSPFERAVQSMLFVGMGVASVVTTAGYRPFVLTHILLGLLPMYGFWIWSAILDTGGWIEILIPVIGVLYASTLYAISRNVHKLYNEVYDNRKTLQEALYQAEAAGRAKTRFLASASHDLRQPIHSLSLFSASLALRTLDEKSKDIVNHIDYAIRSLTLQLDGLLDISKLDAEVVPVNKDTIALPLFLERLVTEYKSTAMEKRLSLVLDCPETALIRTDPTLLERILSNLLNNAIKYSDRGTVSLHVRANDDNWDLEVQDTGPGIPEEEHNNIFEEFYQIDNQERDKEKGLGLGLAIVRRLADLLDLPLELTSDVGTGSTFTLTLPGERRKGARKNNTDHGDTFLTSLSVLVVDDEAEVRLGMKEILESWGCTVLLADSTESAIGLAQHTQLDIAVIDFRLRGSDNGIQTIQELHKIHPKLPSLLISGDTAPERLRLASEAGIHLIHKPVLPDVLKKAIADACHL